MGAGAAGGEGCLACDAGGGDASSLIAAGTFLWIDGPPPTTTTDIGIPVNKGMSL